MDLYNTGTVESVETAEIRAVLPGRRGLDCIFCPFLAYKTYPLREEVYIVIEVEEGEFRPLLAAEHFPVQEPWDYQITTLFRPGVHEEIACGMGRELEITFGCYSPSGSGAAEKAVRLIEEVVVELQDLEDMTAANRRAVGFMAKARYILKKRKDGSHGYRPPRRTLAYRSGPPSPREEM